MPQDGPTVLLIGECSSNVSKIIDPTDSCASEVETTHAIVKKKLTSISSATHAGRVGISDTPVLNMLWLVLNDKFLDVAQCENLCDYEGIWV